MATPQSPPGDRDPGALTAHLSGWLQQYPSELANARFCVAFSGGRDSTVLLHAMRVLQQERLFAGLRAVHIDHGLHSQSGAWAVSCREACQALDVPLRVIALQLVPAAGESVEAEARGARYAALAAGLQAGEWLLTAHHQDDQLETFLLQLFRGAGVAGLAAMPEVSPLGGGHHARPLLGLPRAAILDYARRHGLGWIEDPSNTGDRFDRSWLRNTVLPLLRQRWPAVGRTVSRSASHCAEASGLLTALAAADAARCVDDGRLSLPGLQLLSRPRQVNLLRWWIDSRGLPMPGSARLRSILDNVVGARADAMPQVSWAGGEVRRYRGHLYGLQPDPGDHRLSAELPWQEGASIALGAGQGRLVLVAAEGRGLRLGPTVAHIEVGRASGKECLRLAASRPARKLRNLYQEQGVLPWMRARLPLLSLNGQLAAVADLWLESSLVAGPGEPGLLPVWEDRPRTH